MYPKLVFHLLQPLPGDFQSNNVTSGHLRSRDVISRHVTHLLRVTTL